VISDCGKHPAGISDGQKVQTLIRRRDTMIEFKRPELNDRDLINGYLAKQKSRSCEHTFANTYLWSRFYGMEFAVVNNMLVYKNAQTSFGFPVGSVENAKKTMDILMDYYREQNVSFKMQNVSPEQFSLMDEWYPGEFEIEYDRDTADYIYEAEKLAKLSGKKYHGKKNHTNKFKSLYPDWSYESIGAQNLEECFQMALKWRNENGCDDDEEKNAEICVTLNSLRLYKELALRGGLLRANGVIVAFSIGEPLCDDTFVVHIEKAFADIPGAYPMINQQFVIHETEGYTYINREEDMGEEGLRTAKMSYRPVFLVEKGRVRRKGEA